MKYKYRSLYPHFYEIESCSPISAFVLQVSFKNVVYFTNLRPVTLHIIYVNLKKLFKTFMQWVHAEISVPIS